MGLGKLYICLSKNMGIVFIYSVYVVDRDCMDLSSYQMRGVFECICNFKLDQNKMYNYIMNFYQVLYEERSKVYQDIVKKLCLEFIGWLNCIED